MLVNFDSLKTFYNALKQKMKNYRGNWNQNDSTADDYIKNRPFYSEGVKEIILIDSVASTESNSNGTTTSIYYAFIEDPNLKSFKEGQSYTVALDNVNYECTGFVPDGEAAGVTLGNATLFDSSHPSSNNDAPFVMVVFEGEGCMMILTEFGDHPVVVKTVEEVVHKLDKKFVPIPDDVVSEDDLANVAFSGDYNDLYNTPTSYNDVVRYDITQSLSEAQKTIARENIGAGTSSFSGDYNDLENKPCSATIVQGSIFATYNITIDAQLAGGMPYGRSSSDVMPTNTSYNEIVINGVSYPVTLQTIDSIIYCGNPSLFHPPYPDTGEKFCLSYKQVDDDIRVYFYMPASGKGDEFIITVKQADTMEYIPLEDGYIPDTIARVSDVPDNVYTKEETYSKEEIYTKEETYTKEEADAKFFSSDATVDEIANVVLERLPTWEGGSY